MTAQPPLLTVIIGATASGKTGLAVALAKHMQGEIISADSRQVYRGLDIGSGKDLNEYGRIPHHLIDIVDPGYEFNVYEFQQYFCKAFDDIQQRQQQALLVGGTGLYLDAILSQYQFTKAQPNPALRMEMATLSHDELCQRLQDLQTKPHNTTDMLDRERLERAIEIAHAERKTNQSPAELDKNTTQLPLFTPLVLGIQWPRPVLQERITSRLKQRLEQGLVEEVTQLHQRGVTWETLHFYGLEYRFVAQHLQGLLSYNDMYQKLNSAIHQFAKQQEKWFRRISTKGAMIHWMEGDSDLQAQAMQHIQRATNQSKQTY